MEHTKNVNIDINDSLRLNDGLSNGVKMPDLTDVQKKFKSLWKKTEILVGAGEVINLNNPFKKTSFAPGTPFTKSSNMVPVGGVEYAMELLFGENTAQFTVPTLYEETGIGLANSLPPTETYQTPDGNKSIIYRYGHKVQLFGIGVTGTAENDVTVYPVDYREYSIGMSRVSDDGLTLKGTMIPFRYTAAQLSSVERRQYFGKKVATDGNTGYYLKRFESDPVIKHIWKTGDDVDNETLVSSSDIWDNSVGTNTVESMTEIVLKITKEDVKEYFISLEQEDRTRINTIALFNGRFVKNAQDASDYGDYQDVRLFSKLNIPVEYLTLAKDLNIIYRVYGA